MAESEEMLLVVSKVKAEVKAQGMRSGDDFLAALNRHVHDAIKAAVANAKENKRQTLKDDDI